MPQTLPEYLANGGVGEILRKMGRNLLGYYSQIPYGFGILLFPLFVVASLTRFTNPRVNRLRVLAYVLLVAHLGGLSAFVPYNDGLPLLLMYLPFTAVIGTTFFLNLIRARSLPPFYPRLAVTAWVVIACVPGVVQLVAGNTSQQARTYAVFGDVRYGRQERLAWEDAMRTGVLMSEVPWELAYRRNVPAVWLPNSALDVRGVEQRIGKTISGIVMTPTLSFAYANDPGAAVWRGMYVRLNAILITASYMEPAAQRNLLSNPPRFMSPELQEVMGGFAPQPVPELGSTAYSLFWIDKRLAR